MRVALIQTKPKTGDLEGNLEQIVRGLCRARKEGADIAVVPETSLTAYCCGARFEQRDFVRYQKEMVEKIIPQYVPDDLVAIVPYVDLKGTRLNGKPDITNSLAVIQGHKIVDTYDKILLANDDHHEDGHYFTPGTVAKVIEVTIKGRKMKLGTPICEDVWSKDHDRDIVQEMVDKGAEIIICPNFSYMYYGKQEKRRNLFGNHAKQKHVPVIGLNAVGIGDILKNFMIYDGRSAAFDAHGNQIVECDAFKEDFRIVGVDLKDPTPNPIIPKKWEKYEEIYEALRFCLKETWETLGLKKGQVHISGGIDSAVVAALAADALGPENCVFITNPTVDNGPELRGFGQYVSDQLGIPLYVNETQAPFDSVLASHMKTFGKEPPGPGMDSIQAVLRTVQGLAAAHTFGTGIIPTGNHTEIVLGWASFHDIGSIGVASIIGDLTKTEVFEMAEYINRRNGKIIIPEELYNGKSKPAAELRSAKYDPIDYYIMSAICAELIRHNASINDLVGMYRTRTLTPDYFPRGDGGKKAYTAYTEEQFTSEAIRAFNLAQRSVFKAGQSAPIPIISPRSRGFSDRETIFDKYQGWCDINGVAERLAERYQSLKVTT